MISKKAGLKIGLTELIGTVLVLILIVPLMLVVANIVGIFTSDKDQDRNLASYTVLKDRINELITANNFKTDAFSYQLEEDYFLIGFSYDDSAPPTTQSGRGLEYYKRSLQSTCPGACLCLIKGDDFITDNPRLTAEDHPPLSCTSFEQDVVFLAPPDESDSNKAARSAWNPDYYAPFSSYEYLIFSGFSTEQNHGELYLDTYTDSQNNVFIFVAEYGGERTPLVQQRRIALEDRYLESQFI